jgi:hypothetical protein
VLVVSAMPMSPERAKVLQQREFIAARGAKSRAEVAWSDMHYVCRLFLVQLCTERDDSAANIPWRSFTEAERITMGAQARQFQRDLARAGDLR